ncbi:pentatricopeptide repeat-containing protein [Tanacetum coccineum]
MSHTRPLPSVVKFTELLNDVTKMKHFSSFIHLLNRICALGVPVNEYTVSIVIRCCCQLHRSNDGFAVLGYCFKQDIVTNTAIFSTLLNGLFLESKIREAKRLFEKVITNKLCEPNVVIYSIMIKGHCKTHDYVAAVGLLKLMDENGCKPNVVAYTTIIDSKCKHKMIDDAFKLFKKMVLQKGMSPNVITYISLISGLCKVGRWEQASKLLKEMLDEKMSPNVQTFNILVDTFCKDGKIEEAEDAINLMLERGIVPNIVTYSSLLNGYCLQGEMSKARSLFDLIVSKGIMPNVVTYNTLSKGYCKELKIYEAMHMFQEITKQGLEPNVVTYNTMLQGLFFVKHCEDTHKFFAEMQAQGHAPNERTYAIMLKGLCDNNQMEDALSLFLCDNIQHFFHGDLFGDNSVRREVSNQGPPTPDRLPNRASHASAGPGKRIVKPSSYLLSPYMNQRTKVVPKITKLEFIIGNSLFAMQGDKIENIFEAHSEKFSVFGIRLNLETLAPGLWIDANVIDCWGAILNYEERFRDAESKRRHFFPIGCITQSNYPGKKYDQEQFR